MKSSLFSKEIQQKKGIEKDLQGGGGTEDGREGGHRARSQGRRETLLSRDEIKGGMARSKAMEVDVKKRSPEEQNERGRLTMREANKEAALDF